MEHINNITTETYVLVEAAKNKTSFTIDVSLHPSDIEHVESFIIECLNNGFAKTKESINEVNTTIDWVNKFRAI